MRASFYVMGPLLGRFGETKVSLPGGCAWGPRPVDYHLKGFESLGAKIDLKQGYILAHSENLTGGSISFEIASVGATANEKMLKPRLLNNPAIRASTPNLFSTRTERMCRFG